MHPTLLVVHVDTHRVTASVTDAGGRLLGSADAPLVPDEPRPGWAELAPEAVWRAGLHAVRRALDTSPAPPAGLSLTGAADTLVLWDHDTLGSPRPLLTGADRRAASLCEQLPPTTRARVEELTGLRPEARQLGPRLAWLAEHEPHTWALVQDGRYAVGPICSYLLARMTRGLWHACDDSAAPGTLLQDPRRPGAWSAELCDLLGVPSHALPELVPTRGTIATTDPRVFLDLAVPVGMQVTASAPT